MSWFAFEQEVREVITDMIEPMKDKIRMNSKFTNDNFTELQGLLRRMETQEMQNSTFKREISDFDMFRKTLLKYMVDVNSRCDKIDGLLELMQARNKCHEDTDRQRGIKMD